MILAIIGGFCMYVWMLKQYGSPRELLLVAYFALYALPMYLASTKTYSSLLQYKTGDTGNKMVSALLVLCYNHPAAIHL